ncbi:MAG: class I SAM-dependent methyltransferase [Micavibrio sp.]
MVTSVYDLRSFYDCKKGLLIQPVLQERILNIWPETKDLRVLGCGYALPFLGPYLAESERVVTVMPARLGVHAWEPEGKNLACLAEESELPFETESIDRILLVHSLEHTEIMGPYLQELWRILKSTGRILLVVPNRRGLWARAEWSPFGHGTPYSASQLIRALRDNLFVIERSERALFVPPFRSSMLLRTCLPMERFVQPVVGGMAGVLMVEASKQLYSGVLAQQTAKMQIRGRRILVPSAAPGG